MFDWYRNAVACYAYLSDVYTGPGFKVAEQPEYSRWFKRGWTLQELLAPENVVFYDQLWNKFGTKRTLAAVISKVTNIDMKLLLGQRAMKGYSIAQKMSWAASPRTTRIEDIAYSLLGIFELQMPLLYGEGARAFAKLQEEILKTSDDESIFAWKSDYHGPISPERSGILAQSPSNFRNSSLIVPGPTHSSSVQPFRLSKAGMRLSVRLKIADESILGLLNCYSSEFPQNSVAILIDNLRLDRPSKSKVNRYSHKYPFFRTEPHTFEYLPITGAMNLREVVFNPVWTSHSETSRFPAIAIEKRFDLGKFGHAFHYGKSVLPVHSYHGAKSLICYTFGNRRWPAGPAICVKMQWLENAATVDARVAIRALNAPWPQAWHFESIEEPFDTVNEQIFEGILDPNGCNVMASVERNIRRDNMGSRLILLLRVAISGAEAVSKE